MSHAVMWFRRDLRLEDNPAWAAACDSDSVTALYVLDPRLTARSPRRTARLMSQLAILDMQLSGLGGRLHVRSGVPETVVPATMGELGATELAYSSDVSPFSRRRDAAVNEAVDALGVSVHRDWGHLVQPPGSVVTRAGHVSRVFTPFFRAWVGRPLRRPALRSVDPSLTADPGEGIPDHDSADEAGSDALAERLARADALVQRDARDREHEGGTTHLSADLKWGTVSPVQLIRRWEGRGPGADALIRQLAWRDWWAHLLWEHPDTVSDAANHRLRSIEWRNDPTHIDAWVAGRTGYPVVDAAMRQLATTGWLHNRLRMVAGSFLTKHLLVDWRIGEDVFRRALDDGDTAQNVGNWQWIAGTGHDAAPYFRIFNPITQSRRFSPNGGYLRRWLPELAGLDDRSIHAPWETEPLDLAEAGVILGDHYPWPIVDHGESRELALAAYAAARAHE